MDDLRLLDNVAWHALTGPQAHFAAGTGPARRYARGFSPIVGFEDAERPDFDAIAAFVEPGEPFYCEGGKGRVAPGWKVEHETTMFKMVWDAAPPAPDATLEAAPLEPHHAAQALDLATLTRPGPFGPRTIELGEYIGFFEGPRLVAMAGERMCAGRFREISGVCTHPERQGRGSARRLMLELVRRQLRRGEAPFLHVMHDNTLAHDLYRRMGFRDYREVTVRVLARAP